MEVKSPFILSPLLFFFFFFSLPLISSLSFRSHPCHRAAHVPPPLLSPDRLTVLISGYSHRRVPILRSIAASYAASPFIAAVHVLWNNPSTPSNTLADLSFNLSTLYSAGAPVTLHPQRSDGLNLRFLPRRWIRTRGVLVCDDDIEVDSKSVEFAFRVWQLNQDRLIGLFARSHDLDLIGKKWIYTVHPEKYSIILTKFMILKREYLDLYSCGSEGPEDKYSKMRGFVDNFRNCEDILMNFVVADEVGKGPLLVGSERVRDWGDARNEEMDRERVEQLVVGLSGSRRGGGEHRKRRGECITEFHKILGKMPLRYSYGKVVNSIGEQGLCEKGGKLVPCDEQV